MKLEAWCLPWRSYSSVRGTETWTGKENIVMGTWRRGAEASGTEETSAERCVVKARF